jgi:pimeloyl-ACP methyl ester carboxylesterase
MATAAVVAIREAAGERPIVAEGFSLGCIAALYLGAHGRVDGLLLRNPPPLRELIHYRTSWWTPGLVPALVARGIPEAIDSVGNAAGCKVPALFVTASQDQVVPAEYQYRIIDAYGGDHRVLEQPQGGHATPLSESEINQLERLAAWLLGNLDSRC